MRDGDREMIDEALSAYELGQIDGCDRQPRISPDFTDPRDTDAYNRGWYKGRTQ